MSGALIGLILGGWLFHLPGAILGLWLGFIYDRSKSRLNTGRWAGNFGRSRQPNQKEQALFFHSVFSVMGHIAKAGGRVTEQQIQIASLFMDRMELQGELRREAQDSFREGKDPAFDLQQAMVLFRQSCRGRPDLIRVFLDIQLQAAFANGVLQPLQRQKVIEVSALLGFSAWEMEQLLRMVEARSHFSRGNYQSQQQNYGGSSSYQAPPRRDELNDAYATLGVDASASDSDVKKAYRKQMSLHHPDKLAAKGLPPEMMNMEKEKAQAIQHAWEMIKKARDIR